LIPFEILAEPTFVADVMAEDYDSLI